MAGGVMAPGFATWGGTADMTSDTTTSVYCNDGPYWVTTITNFVSEAVKILIKTIAPAPSRMRSAARAAASPTGVHRHWCRGGSQRWFP